MVKAIQRIGIAIGAGRYQVERGERVLGFQFGAVSGRLFPERAAQVREAREYHDTMPLHEREEQR